MPKKNKSKVKNDVQNLPNFEIEDFVFAKLRGFSPWPAQIINVGKDGVMVYFFGTHDRALVKRNQLYHYNEYKHQFITKGRSRKKDFRQAVQEIDCELRKFNSDAEKVVSENNATGENQNEEKGDIANTKRTNNTHDAKKDTNKSSSDDTFMESYLKEKKMLNFLYGVASSLTLKNPKLDKCIKEMSKFEELNINAILLKKHPEFVKMMGEIRRYIGCKEWTEDEVQKNKQKVQIIKTEANKIYNELAKLFVIPENKTFPEFFSEEVSKFKEKTKHLPLQELISITSDEDIPPTPTKEEE